jgi:anaphase-promoting complex subunit 6
LKPSPIRSPYIRKEEVPSQNDLIYHTLDKKNNIDILNVKAKKAYYSYDIASAYDWSLKAIK